MPKDGYKTRTLVSEVAPLDPDSDSDFNPGHYSDPDKKANKKRKSSPRKSRSSASSNKRTRDEFERSNKVSVHKPPRKRRRTPILIHNPLSEFFDVPTEYEAEKEDNDEDDDEYSMFDSDEEQPKSPSPKPSKFPPPKAKKPSPKPDDDSATESDDDYFAFSPSAKKAEPDPDNSDTEEDDDDFAPPAKPQASPSTPPSNDDDSATEDDEEEDFVSLKPRPGFALAPGANRLGPLVLDAAKSIEVPAAINTYLRDYQREGVKFFYRQYKQGQGGLLGDDMGLGKTIQVISFLSAIMKKKGLLTDKDRRANHVSKLQDGVGWRRHRRLPPANATWPTCLIIAPSTVASNWERELQTWGYFEVGMYTTGRREREIVLEDFKKGRLDIVVTSFDLARRDIDALASLSWSCIFIDEVHRVKNEKAKITQAYMQFDCTIRFGLTGTAIQNNYGELWTILNWTNEGQVGTSKQWDDAITRPLTMGQSKAATEDERVKSMEVRDILVKKFLPRYFLRREKDLIKDQLPQKIDQAVFCPLTDKQIEVYKHVLATRDVQNMVKKDDPCDCGSKRPTKECCHEWDKRQLFTYISILIKLSNHLALLLPAPGDSDVQREKNNQYKAMIFPDGDGPTYGIAMMNPSLCGKWLALEKLLFEWRSDKTNKVLIFTKSVKLLDILEHYVKMQCFGFNRLDGQTPQNQRMRLIDEFHSDPNKFIFLISTLAGGTGLNLTGANKVVIFDPNWNPAHDLQAMDRAFRIGQTRNVEVFRLLGLGSLEELIYKCQIYKQQQMAIGYKGSIQTPYFEGVRGKTIEKPGELFGIKNLFKFQEDTVGTKEAIQKAKIAHFDWALANMDAGGEIKLDESRIDNEDFSGLENLLLNEPSGDLLGSAGVKYRHRNDDVLMPSRVEEQRIRKEVAKKRTRKSEPEYEWPPKRPSRKRPRLTPEELLYARRQSLLDLGQIGDPSDETLAEYATIFMQETPERQGQILKVLDEHWRDR